MLDGLRLVSYFDRLTTASTDIWILPKARTRCLTVHDFEKLTAYHKEILDTLLLSLADRIPSSIPLKTLSLCGIPCIPGPYLNEPKSHVALLGGIERLKLDFALGDLSNLLYQGEYSVSSVTSTPFDFIADLDKIWLSSSSNLTILELCADECWGYYPKVDFRDTNYPRLRSLILGGFTFSHVWQLQWLQRLASLERLELSGCSIVRQSRVRGPRDKDGYPTGIQRPRRTDADMVDMVYSYDNHKCWSGFFEFLATSLDNLRYFSMDPDHRSSNWWPNDESESGQDDMDGVLMMHPLQYLSFEYFVCGYRATVVLPKQHEDGYSEWLERLRKDNEALQHLLVAVRGRNERP